MLENIQNNQLLKQYIFFYKNQTQTRNNKNISIMILVLNLDKTIEPLTFKIRRSRSNAQKQHKF